MRLLDVFYEIGSWSIEGIWLPLLAWTAVALPLLMLVRFGDSIQPHVRYRAALATLAALPLGLLASMIVAFDAPAVREVAAIVVLPEIEAVAAHGAGASSVWTVYHTAGAAVLLAALLAGWRIILLSIAAGQLIRYRTTVAARSPRWLAKAADDLREELGLRRKVTVAACNSVASPLTFGSHRPLILLPSRLLDSQEDLRLALVHELIHIRRRDYLMQWTEQLVGALFYVHPLVALFRREIAILREITCDADVLAYADNRPRYARLLYRYAAPPTPDLDMAVGIVFRQHDLSKRIKSMKELLDIRQVHRSKRIGVVVSVVLLAVAMVVVACSDVLVHPSPRNDEAPVVEKQARDAETYVIVEDMPELVGGLASIQKNLQYPELAKKAGVEGRVILQFVVDEKGFVVDPHVVRGLGSGLDEAAIEAVQSAKFKPGMQDGQPVKVKMSLPITFKLASGNAAQQSDGAQGRAQAPRRDGDGRFVFVDEMPTLVNGLASIQEHLRYPQLAKDAGVEGRVIVEFIVDEVGNVVDPRVVRGLGSGLDAAAIEAVRAAQFTPGQQDGEPVKVKMALPITFALGDQTRTRSEVGSSSPQQTRGENVVRLRIDGSNRIYVENERVDVGRLSEALAKHASVGSTIVSLQVNANASMGTVTDVQHKLRELGVKGISYESR